MFKQAAKRCGVVALIACCAITVAAAGDGPVGGIRNCSAVHRGTIFDACAMPPKVCPNGAFTGYEVCRASTSHQGCPGVGRADFGWSDEYTGLRLFYLSCGAEEITYNEMKCQCFGNLFGYCTGPCEPTGGISGMDIPCPGTMRRLLRCEEGE